MAMSKGVAAPTAKGSGKGAKKSHGIKTHGMSKSGEKKIPLESKLTHKVRSKTPNPKKAKKGMKH